MSAITPAERKAFATLLGIHEQYLYQCLTGRREMDAATAMRAETETAGVLKRQMLCQHTYHEIWPDLPALPSEAERAKGVQPIADEKAKAA